MHRRDFMKGLCSSAVIFIGNDSLLSKMLYASKRVKVIGVGGCGCNVVSALVKAGVKDAEFIALDTDKEQLAQVTVPIKIQMSSIIAAYQGIMIEADDIGRRAALGAAHKIKSAIIGSDIVIVVAGMGGNIGTSAAPVIAGFARELRVMTAAVVSTPFAFEGLTRRNRSGKGLAALEKNANIFMVLENDKLLEQMDRKVSLLETFELFDQVLAQKVNGIIHS